MKKYLLLVLLFIMFIPFIVNAETCDVDRITIDNITVENKTNNVVELDETTANGKNINLNLSMSEVGDNIEYKFVIKNYSNEDYELNKKSLFLNSDYINYSFETDDDSYTVKKKSSKMMYLNIQYKNEVLNELLESGSYNDNKNIAVTLSTDDIIENPKTGVYSNEINAYLLNKLSGIITKKTNYKMQDWPFNRQRYWGEPFPVVFCPDCGTVPLKEEDLPLTLPYTRDFKPKEDGSSPLSKVEDWVNCKCPKCGGAAKRETDTMPNWAGSSWYWLRYTDPHNNERLADYDKLKYWGSVDCYTGGTEHITRHVLYAFFWQNFLYEIGAVPTRNPFKRKMGSGLILDSEGKKMSKSSTNGVSPLEVINKYGCDAARLHVHFLGGYEDNAAWTYKGINGITNFLNKVWDLQDIVKDGDISDKHRNDLDSLTNKVTKDIEALKLNTAIASCMGFVNKIKKDNYITKEELRRFLILLNPLAPHITSEVYERVLGEDILDAEWPKVETNVKAETNIVICINNKKKFVVKAPMNLLKEELMDYLLLQDDIREFLESIEIINTYYVPNKTINIVTNKKEKKLVR